MSHRVNNSPLKYALTAVLLLATAGCNENGSEAPVRNGGVADQELSASNGDQTTTNPTFNVQFDSVNIDVQVVDKFLQPSTTFSAGEIVDINLVAMNSSSTTYNYYTSGPILDVFVLDSNGHVVWNKFFGKAFPQVVRINELTAAEPLKAGSSWATVDNDGNTVAPGTYYIDLNAFAILKGTDVTIPLIEIQIQ